MSNLKEKNEKKLEVKLNLQETETPLKPVADWTKEDVALWLEKELKLSKEIITNFLSNDINGEILLSLGNNNHFERMKITIANQIIIEKGISKLKEGIFKF